MSVVAKEGYIFIIPPLILAILTRTFDLNALSWLFMFIVFAMCMFFRDPPRVKNSAPIDPFVVYSPADGVVKSIDHIHKNNTPYFRIVIFLSVFDVHINRIPYSGTVQEINTKKGRFHNALDPDIDKKNQQVETIIQTNQGHIRVVQLAGLIARRIVNRLVINQKVTARDRFGLIKFSSRVDLYIPTHARVLVRPKQKVKGSLTSIALFSKKERNRNDAS